MIKLEKNDKNVGIIDKSQANIVRAICAIVVILIHIPSEHGNIVQDAIGSFAYVAVTIFFMLSAYGLKYSVENKEGYLKKFWKNRILVLLIPFWIANIIKVLVSPSSSAIRNILEIIGFGGISFITVLLVYYVIFWLVYRFIKNPKVSDIILCSIVLLYSILGKAFDLPTGWLVESMGFIYGILIYYMIPILSKMKKVSHLILAGIVSILLGVLYLKYKEIYMIGTWLIKTMLGASLVILLVIILNKITIKSALLSYIGNISYEIYLLHNIIINLLINVNIMSALWILLVIMLSILSAMAMNYIDNKIIKRIKN